MKKPLITREQTVGNHLPIRLMVTTRFSDIIIVMSGDVGDPRFCIMIIICIKGLQRDTFGIL